MIKVLHFYKTYYPNTFGGIEQVIFQIAEGGQQQGILSQVLSLNKASTQTKQIKNHEARYSKTLLEFASTPFSLSALRDFKKLAEQADIIHYHFPWPFMDLAHFVCHIKKPSVISYHSDIVKQKNLLRMYKPLMNRFFKHVDAVVASSPNYLTTSEMLKQVKDKVTIIPYGLDRASYPEVSEERKTYWKEKVGEQFFLFIGTFRYYKGLHILIEAAQNSTYPIVIVGAGPIEQELKEQANRLGVNNIHFLGALGDEDKVALLDLCMAVVFPSYLRSEAFGITLLEGAMFSKPLISCEIGTGTTYVNIANETGLVVPPADPQALRQAMDKLWQEPELVYQLGQNAGKRYQTIFTSEQMVEKYMSLYKDVLARKENLINT